VRRGMKLRRRPGGRGRTGLVSTIGPVAIGVLLGFAWNMTAAQPHTPVSDDRGVTQQAGLAVEQAAAQAWASTTPSVTPSTAGRPHGTGRPAGRNCRASGLPSARERAAGVRAVSVCRPRPKPRVPSPTQTDSLVSVTITRGPARS